jgi:hypothetical protein
MSTGCLDSQENEVSCNDADCSFGPCGDITTANSQTGNNACLDAQQNPINCSDPTCALGDCIDSTSNKNMSALGAVAAATTGAGGAAPSTSPLGIFSQLSSAAATAFASTQGATTGPRVVATPGFSLNGSSGLLLLGLVGIVAYLALRKKTA